MSKKILLVDDDPDLVKSVKVILENQKYRVIVAGSKDEGLKKLSEERPDLVILDVMMEKTHDGFEMSRIIRKNKTYDGIPILIFTGIDKETGVNFRSAAGDKVTMPVDGYITKPVTSNELLTEIKNFLEK